MFKPRGLNEVAAVVSLSITPLLGYAGPHEIISITLPELPDQVSAYMAGMPVSKAPKDPWKNPAEPRMGQSALLVASASLPPPARGRNFRSAPRVLPRKGATRVGGSAPMRRLMSHSRYIA
jgi:hypothetical protein